ncbi:hypothetical protein MTR67_022748, partial [Solanum verrucosum]
ASSSPKRHLKLLSHLLPQNDASSSSPTFFLRTSSPYTQAPLQSFFLRPYASIASHCLPHVIPHLPFRKSSLRRRKNAPSVTQHSQIDLKRSILERFFFLFMITFPFPLRFVFPRFQNLNSWIRKSTIK